jgi:chromosome segregation ATPase
MQFLVLLIEGAPSRIAIERQFIERLLTELKDHLRDTLDTSQEYHVQLEQRLSTLPEEIARGISPEAIAGTIKENLRQQFIRSTLPETAEALAATSLQIKKVCGEFSATARDLGDAYRGAAQDAKRAVGAMRSEISSVTNAAESAIKELSVTFHKAYRWTAYSLSGLAVLIGFVLGAMATYWFMSPPKPVAEAPPPVVQAAPQEVPKPKKKR